MARISVITSDKENETQEGIIVFPQNRTLYVDQFTDEIPADDEEREVFKPRNMRDVFDYYRPTKHDIELETEEGEVVYEDFSFYSIEDFEDNQLIAHSALLWTEQNKIDAYKTIFRQLKENKTLQNVIKDDASCADLKNALKALLSEIDDEDENYRIDNPEELLLKSTNGNLSQFGGFKIITTLIKGSDNMDPKRKNMKNIFLYDAAYTNARQKMKNELELWVFTLEKGKDSPMEILESCESEYYKAEQCLATNLDQIHDAVKQLEITYRTLDTFFANTGHSEVDFLTLMNVNKEQLKDWDSDDTKAVKKELNDNYDKLFMKDNYSLLVAPGYLGDAETVRMWARTAYENKVIMVTDFKDSLNFEMLKDELDDASLQGQDAHLANVIMTCNYLLGRKKSKLVKEEGDLFIPGSGALAGRMTDTESIPISQGVAGMKYGILSNVKDVRFNLSKVQIATLMDQGVVPMVKMDGRVMPFSNRSLYDGAIYEFKEYPIVRVLDWIEKAIQSYLNIQSLRIWDSKMKEECRKAIHNFLFDCKNSQIQLVESFIVKKLELDSINKEIHLEIEFRPFISKRLLMEMVGHIDDRGELNWQ